ncbi:MAG: PqqD family peptide modification chaperone [Lachnospiraceae bacterium]|nr:PqqD family peptide modification chaperone [Lachnospiraceae bacterium]
MITSESVIKMKNTPNVTDLAGDKVMVDFAQGKYFMLKGVGNDIWDLMDDGMKVADIVAELQKEYDVSEEECLTETIKFLSELEELNFIEGIE